MSISNTTVIVIALYVDDLLIAGNCKYSIETIKKEQSRKFEMKDLGAARVMLGIEIERDRTNRKLFVCQSEYTKKVLDRFGMSDSKHAATPMGKSLNALVNQESDPANDVLNISIRFIVYFEQNRVQVRNVF